jgi:hypothetical protein
MKRMVAGIGEVPGTVCSANRSGESASSPFMNDLAAVRHDQKLCRDARHWAGSAELAQDALQEAFYLIARRPDHDGIISLTAYFRATLYNVIISLRGRAGPVSPLDPQTLADLPQPDDASRLRGDRQRVDDLAEWHLRCRQWLNRFTSMRDQLLAMVPGSSADPVRYRRLIVAVAGTMLRDARYGCISTSELNDLLYAAYPEWFAPAGCPAATRYKRVSRARQDVNTLLRVVLGDELTS